MALKHVGLVKHGPYRHLADEILHKSQLCSLSCANIGLPEEVEWVRAAWLLRLFLHLDSFELCATDIIDVTCSNYSRNRE